MTVNKFIAIIMLWIVSQFICLSVTGAVFGTAGETGWRNMLNNFTLFSIISGETSWSVVLTDPGSFWNDLVTLFTFNYPCFTGYLVIVRILLSGLSIGLIWGLISTFRGVNS